MPILEFATGDELIEEMRKMFSKELTKEKGGGNRYKLIIAKGNRRAVFQPRVTTQRVNTLLLRELGPIDEEKIKKAAKEIGAEITECLNFWFDERKEPPIKPPELKTATQEKPIPA